LLSFVLFCFFGSKSLEGLCFGVPDKKSKNQKIKKSKNQKKKKIKKKKKKKKKK